jgi:hypothetical protein
MRILLDENLDWRLHRSLPGHEVKSVQSMGWAGTKSGALLSLAQQHFDVFITMDGGIPHQQKITNLNLATIVLKAKSNRLQDTEPLIPQVLALLPLLQAGTITSVQDTR